MGIWGPFSIEGRTAIVTGGAMGIGHGIVDRFAEGGANVLLVDLDGEAAERAATKLAGSPGKVVAMRSDISADGAGRATVERCVAEFGGVDILVNNAGIYPQVPMLEMTRELFDRVYMVNLRALAFLSQAVGRRMAEQGSGGAIVNIGSIDSLHPSMVGLAAYDASKGGVLMFTRNFALEMAPHKVRVNMVAPGGVTTEGTAKPLEGSGMTQEQQEELMRGFAAQIPAARMGRPDDIATAVVFLASGAADYVTGATLVVDGGKLLT